MRETTSSVPIPMAPSPTPGWAERHFWRKRSRQISAVVHCLYRVEDLVGRRLLQILSLQFVCKNVQQRLGVGTRIEVPAILLDQRLFQFIGVGEVAVVGETNAVW